MQAQQLYNVTIRFIPDDIATPDDFFVLEGTREREELS